MSGVFFTRDGGRSATVAAVFFSGEGLWAALDMRCLLSRVVFAFAPAEHAPQACNNLLKLLRS